MITKAQTADLLTVIAALDKRTVGDADVEGWHLIIADLELNDCAQAVKDHYTEHTTWLMPADVHRRATAIARQRLGRQRLAELEAQRLAEEEADRLAIAAGPPADREALERRFKAAVAQGGRAVPREDPRSPDVRRAEARRELDRVRDRQAARTAVVVNERETT